jgi:hypothetical protein
MKNPAVMVAQLSSAAPKASYRLARRPVVNVGSILGEPVDSTRMIGLVSSDSRRG